MGLPEITIGSPRCSDLRRYSWLNQLTVMVPQPEVQYHTNGGVPPVPGASLGIHMMARSDGIVLGGTSQRGVWTMEPDEAERKRVVDSHIAVFSAMKGARLA